MANKQKKKGRGWVLNTILIIILIAGIAIMAYPTFSDWWNSMHQTRAIAGYVEQVTNIDHEEIDRMWAEAEAYNVQIRSNPNRFTMTEEELEEYNQILDVTGTGIMGYIDIPKIDVSLPIYHGTNESVLQIAVGHIEGTSLPVGGESTHAVLSGHRGLPSAKLFTDIADLVVGDRFYLNILGQELTYEVDDIHVVLPDELQNLQIEEGKDYVTLVTCTPYAINTHRLLVRGKRVENEKAQVSVPADSVRVDTTIVALIVGIPLLLVLAIIALIASDKRREQKQQEILERALSEIHHEENPEE